MAKDLKEQIEIMTHYLNGGEVECAETGFDEWEIANDPCWNWDSFDYRIKKPKVTIEKWLIKDVDSGEHFIIGTSDIEINLKNFPELKKIKLIESYEVEL